MCYRIALDSHAGRRLFFVWKWLSWAEARKILDTCHYSLVCPFWEPASEYFFIIGYSLKICALARWLGMAISLHIGFDVSSTVSSNFQTLKLFESVKCRKHCQGNCEIPRFVDPNSGIVKTQKENSRDQYFTKISPKRAGFHRIKVDQCANLVRFDMKLFSCVSGFCMRGKWRKNDTIGVFHAKIDINHFIEHSVKFLEF